MFKATPEQDYETRSESGVRHLFALGPYDFQDTLDAEGAFHHFILEAREGDAERPVYQVDRDTMYEFMARFLAGVYEMEEYSLDHSPGHAALLDVLELATARARAGESDFAWDEFDPGETEVLDEDFDPDQQP